jgi:hypothetical protein
VRIKALPPHGQFEEFDLQRYQPGEVYDIPSQLASLLIIAGYAEVAAPPRSTAADSPRSPKR